MSDYTVMEYLHSGDTIYWSSPDDGSQCGPAVITGFWQTGIDAEGRPGQGVTIAPQLVRGISYANIPAMLITRRVAVSDGSTMHFQWGGPV